jgi:hypothetical protein
MAPSPIGTHFPSPTRQKIPNTQRDDHEKITCEVIAVDEGSGDSVDQILPFQIEDLPMAAEEFEYPVERLPYADCQDDNKEWTYRHVALPKGLPVKEKEEEPDEGQPLEEMDLGNERDETEWKAQSWRLKAQSRPDGIGLGGKDF